MSEGRWLHRTPIADAEPGALILPRGRPRVDGTRLAIAPAEGIALITLP